MEKLPRNPQMPSKIAEEMGLFGVVEEDVVLEAVRQAIKENPDAVSDYYEGKKNALNFLIGQVMRITRGKADPGKTFKLLEEELKK
jgi:aspartyl-tRNA(Asn)/glutamyl-tRNA(Gln) amidotransferase subunit B